MKFLDGTALVCWLLLTCVGCTSHAQAIPLFEARKPSIRVAKVCFRLQFTPNLPSMQAEPPSFHFKSLLPQLLVLAVELLHFWRLCSPFKFYVHAPHLAVMDVSFSLYPALNSLVFCEKNLHVWYSHSHS